MTHAIVQKFELQAKLLDVQQSSASLDDALIQLAGWIGGAEHRLVDDDLVALVHLGGILYREGLRKRKERSS